MVGYSKVMAITGYSVVLKSVMGRYYLPFVTPLVPLRRIGYQVIIAYVSLRQKK